MSLYRALYRFLCASVHCYETALRLTIGLYDGSGDAYYDDADTAADIDEQENVDDDDYHITVHQRQHALRGLARRVYHMLQRSAI